jgi:hypothetical protein
MLQGMDRKKLSELVEDLKPIIYGDLAARSFLQEQGISVTRSDFYSEIPTITEIQNPRKGPRLDRIFPTNIEMLAFLEEIKLYSIEFKPAIVSDDETEFSWENSQFSFSDAMAYYCMIRLLKPNQIVEIGGGFSTLIAKIALEKNGFGRLKVIEPFPREFLHKVSGIELVQVRFQDLDNEALSDSIGDGDIVFIDSTHSLKFGSEVLNIYLDFLHLIKSQCFVHVHDIFLPDPLPPAHMLDHQVYWGEQYLLYAYLLNNPRTQVLFGSNFHVRNNPDKLEDLMAGQYQPGGASFWFKQNPA